MFTDRACRMRGAPLWFSHEITPQDCPWIFETGNQSSRAISTIEALAVLTRMHGDNRAKQRMHIQVAHPWTDNIHSSSTS